MAIALIITDRDVTDLQQQLRQTLGRQVPVWIYPEIPRKEAVKMAVVWKHPPGLLATFPNLKLVSSFGAGVEHILQDQTLPPGPAITRIVDDSLSLSMRNYVLMVVLNIQRQFRQLQRQQQKNQWIKPMVIELPLHLGVLGLGALGSRIARDLAGLGFQVSGFSRTPKSIPGVTTFSRQNMTLPEFASRTNTLISILPGTPATEGILNLSVFSRMPPGSFLIQVGRGAHLVETDLLKALNDNMIREAWLDVFTEEPLPSGHPFWKHDHIVITPHIASVTDQMHAAQIIAGNYHNMLQGKDLQFEVDRKKGY